MDGSRFGLLPLGARPVRCTGVRPKTPMLGERVKPGIELDLPSHPVVTSDQPAIIVEQHLLSNPAEVTEGAFHTSKPTLLALVAERPDIEPPRIADAELGCDLIGGAEADAADVAGQAIGVLRDELDGLGAVSLVDAHRARGADAVAVQEQHDLADDLLLGPTANNALRPLRADPGHLPQTASLLL